MIDDGDCGEIGEMKIGRGNRSTAATTGLLYQPQMIDYGDCKNPT
jgi:hypothetical protein